jgi:VWFA-related protein
MHRLIGGTVLKRTLITAVAAMVLATQALSAQTQPKESTNEKLSATVEVRVINIDVVVNDKKGNPVRGLTAADFDVFENGVPQNITNFSEITEKKAAPAAAKAPAAPGAITTAATPAIDEDDRGQLQRRIIFYVDNLSLAPFNRNRVFTAMKKFAQETMQPGDTAMIATWNRSLKVRVPFTSDVTQIIQNLDAIAGESSFGLQNLADRRRYESQIRDATSYSEAVGAARQYAQSVEHDLRQSVSAINGLMSTLAGVDGKKILVLTSEGMPMSPGKEMFYFIDDVKKDKKDWTESGSAMLEAMGFDSSALIKSVATTANANNITLYTLHAGGLVADTGNSAENDRPTAYTVSNAALTNSTDSMYMLADMTGGRATVGTNNFGGALAQIRSDLASYYSLGYRATTERVDRQRSVQVRAKNRNYVVRSRRTFVEKSIGTEMTDRVIANLFYPQKSNDLNITVITGTPVQIESDRFRVPLEIRIPMESLTFLPQGELNLGQFSVFVAVADQLGDMSDVSRQSKQFALRPDELTKISGKYYTYALDLVMAKGRNKISVGVVDEISNTTGFDRREILAADLR